MDFCFPFSPTERKPYSVRTACAHTKAFCVVKPKCDKCGSQHNTRDCQLKEPYNRCFVCGTDHNPADKAKCPKIPQATTHKNFQLKKKLFLFYAEAVKNYIQTSNEFDILSSDDEDLVVRSEKQSHDQPMVKKRKTAATTPLVNK